MKVAAIEQNREAGERRAMSAQEQEAFLNAASEAYHAHPSHTTACSVYQEFYGTGCPCEKAAEAALRAAGY